MSVRPCLTSYRTERVICTHGFIEDRCSHQSPCPDGTGALTVRHSVSAGLIAPGILSPRASNHAWMASPAIGAPVGSAGFGASAAGIALSFATRGGVALPELQEAPIAHETATDAIEKRQPWRPRAGTRRQCTTRTGGTIPVPAAQVRRSPSATTPGSSRPGKLRHRVTITAGATLHAARP